MRVLLIVNLPASRMQKKLAQWEVKQPYLMVDSQIKKVPVYAGAGRSSIITKKPNQNLI